MKQILYIISCIIIFDVLLSCGPFKADPAFIEQQRSDSIRIADSLHIADSIHLADSIRLVDSLRLADSIRIADSIADIKKKHDADAIQFIIDMYNEGKFYEESFLKEHCTPKMLKYLRDAYDYDCYDGDCLATWEFRSGMQDGPNDTNCIVSVTSIGDDWYRYIFYDMGNKASNIINIIDINGKLMIDGVKNEWVKSGLPL